jgi:hypothetical protein
VEDDTAQVVEGLSGVRRHRHEADEAALLAASSFLRIARMV